MTVFMYILYDLSIFILGMFYWDVFHCAWQGPWKNSLVLNGFFTLYKYIWKKKPKKNMHNRTVMLCTRDNEALKSIRNIIVAICGNIVDQGSILAC